MHLYTISRGHKNDVDRVINHLLAQYYKINNKGKEAWFQLGIRPVQLWEISFPEKELKNILATIPNSTYIKKDKWLTMIRKVIGCFKIPKLDLKGAKKRIIPFGDVCFHHIGLKKDKFIKGFGETL